MRLLPEISRIYDSGVFVGENRSHHRVTVEPYWQLHTTGDSVGTSVRGPYRWWKRDDDDRLEVEVPNIKTIDIDRSIQSDVASCRIEMYNQWHVLNDEGVSPEALQQLGDPGHFWFERGKNPQAEDRWAHTESLGAHDKEGNYLPDFSWKNVLVPNALIRTYQGYGGYDENNNPLPIADAEASGNLVITGVWLIDTVTAGSNGMLSISMRDIGRLLLEQHVFPPLAPRDHYPVSYYGPGPSAFASIWGPQYNWTNNVNVVPGRRAKVPILYWDSSVDRWAVAPTNLGGWGAAVTHTRSGVPIHYNAELADGAIEIGGIRPRGSFTTDGQVFKTNGVHRGGDPNASPAKRTFALSVGNEYPNAPYAFDFWEWVINPNAEGNASNYHEIDEIEITPYGGGYEMYVSVTDGSQWFSNGLGNIPYEYATFDTHADIPYVMKVRIPQFDVGQERPIQFSLPQAYNASRIRLTFTNGMDHGIGENRFRAGIRDFGVFNSTPDPNSTLPTTRPPTAGLAVDPYTYGLARHPVEGYWVLDTSGNVYGYGQATNGAVSLTTKAVSMVGLPSGDGYYVLEMNGRVHAMGDAQDYGEWVLPGFSYADGPSQGEWGEPKNQAYSIAVNHNGTGYWVAYGDGMIRGFGDVGFDEAIPYGQQGDGTWYGQVQIPGDEQAAGVTQRIKLPGTPVVTWCEIQMRSPKTGRGHWNYKRATAIVGHPKKNGFWVANAHGEYWAFGAAELFNVIDQDGFYGGDSKRHPTWGDPSVLAYGGLWQRTFNKGFAGGFIAGGFVTSIECTENGDGLWLLFGSGQIAQYGKAVKMGPTRFYGSKDPKLILPSGVSASYSTLPPEFLFFRALTWKLVRTPHGNGFWVLTADGGVGTYDTKFWGSPSSLGNTGIRWHKGNIEDYCLDDQSEALTRRGWLRWDEIQIGDEVLGVDPETDTSCWQRVNFVYRKHRNRKMVKMKGASFDAVTTPDHRWLVKTTGDKWKWTTSDALLKSDKIPLRLPGGHTPQVKVLDDDLVELVAWFWTEGTWNDSAASFSQSETANPEKVARIKDLMSRSWGEPGNMKAPLDVRPKWNVRSHSTSGVLIFSLGSEIRSLLRQYLDDDKVVSWEFLNSLTLEQLDLFIDTSVSADGWFKRRDRGRPEFGFSQHHEGRSKAFEYACMLAGRPVVTHKRRLNGKDCWVSTLLAQDYMSPVRAASVRGRATVAEVDYEGVVWCPSVDHGNFVARRNGSVYLTGNTDIVDEMLLWGGWWHQTDDPPLSRANTYGFLEQTGVMTDIQLSEDKWDKKPLMDAIKQIREVVGYHFYIGEHGEAHFASPNWWRAGNLDPVGQRIWVVYESETLPDGQEVMVPRRVNPVSAIKGADGQTVYSFGPGDENAEPYIPELNERTNLVSYAVTADHSSMRSQVIVGSTEPNYWDKNDPTLGAATSAGGFKIYEPPTAIQPLDPDDPESPPTLRGINRPAMYVNKKFTDPLEQKMMIELLQVHSWFAQRVGSVSAPANPALGIDDQIRIIERQTGETYIHYVRSMRTTADLGTGAYTMALETNWLGNAEDWAIHREGGGSGVYDPISRVVVSDQLYQWAVRTDRGIIGEHSLVVSLRSDLDLSFKPSVIKANQDWLYSGTMFVGAPGLTSVKLKVVEIDEWMRPATITIGGQEFDLPDDGGYLDIGDLLVGSDTEFDVVVMGQPSGSFYGRATIHLVLQAVGVPDAVSKDSLVVTQEALTEVGDGNPAPVPVGPPGTDWGSTDVISEDGVRVAPLTGAATSFSDLPNYIDNVLSMDDIEDDITELHEGGALPGTAEGNPYRHGPNVSTASPPVVSLGDMIVVGDSLSALGYHNGNFTADHRWHDTVLGTGIVDNVYSGAYMGATTYSTRQEIEAETYLAPPGASDVFVLFLGANDVNTTTASLQNLGIAEITPEEYEEHLLWFLDNYPAETQIVMYPWRWVYSAQPDIPVDEAVYLEYRDAAAAAATARGAIFIDVGEAIPDATTYTADGIHCNELGIAALADLVLDEIMTSTEIMTPGLVSIDEDVTGYALRYTLVSDDTTASEAMVQVHSGGIGVLRGTTWEVTTFTNQEFAAYGNTWFTSAAGQLTPVNITGVLADAPQVFGWSSVGSNGKQFGQVAANEDDTTSPIHAFGFTAIQDLPDPEAVDGMCWWVTARIVGPDAATADYRMVPGVSLTTAADLAPREEGGFIGRGRVLSSEWQILTGHTCSMAQLEAASPPIRGLCDMGQVLAVGDQITLTGASTWTDQLEAAGVVDSILDGSDSDATARSMLASPVVAPPASSANYAVFVLGANDQVMGTSGNGASSFHAWWENPSSYRFDETSVVLEIIDQPAEAYLYFWAFQVDFTNSGGSVTAGAHCGLQWNPSHPNSTAVNWGGYNSSSVELSGSTSSLPSAPGNANTRDYSWMTGTKYKFRVYKVANQGGEPVGTSRWRCTVEDLSTATVTTVRDLYVPGDRIYNCAMWTEVFAPDTSSPATCRWSQAQAVRYGAGPTFTPSDFYITYQDPSVGGHLNTCTYLDGAGGIMQRTSTQRITEHEQILEL